MRINAAVILTIIVTSPLLCRMGIAAESTHTRRLPEVIVKSRRKDANVMHIAGIVREYSYLQTYFDTVFMYRDKYVDFMIPLPTVKNFVGWKVARTLKSDSYYQFFDYSGKDSVSDRYYLNFSLGNRIAIPGQIRVERSRKDNADFSINLMLDKNAEQWQPGVTSLLKRNTGIEQFDVQYFFENIEGMDLILPVYISKAYYTLQSYGELPRMRLPGLADKKFQVNTKSELYITDRQFLTVKEAKRYQKQPSLVLEKCEFSGIDVPPLPDELKDLVARVKAIDHLKLRLNEKPDSLAKGFYYTHPRRVISFRNWIRGMVGLPALPRK